MPLNITIDLYDIKTYKSIGPLVLQITDDAIINNTFSKLQTRVWHDGGLLIINESEHVVLKQVEEGNKNLLVRSQAVDYKDIILQVDGSWKIICKAQTLYCIQKIGTLLHGKDTLKRIVKHKITATPEQVYYTI